MINLTTKYKIAVIAAGLIEAYQHEILTGILDEIYNYDCTAHIFQCINGNMFAAEFDEGEYNIFSLVDFEEYDGVIVFYNTINIPECLEELQEKSRKTNVPVISIDWELENTYYVGTDNFTAEKEIVDHIIDVHGIRDIGFITGPINNREAEERLNGYKKSLLNHGIEVNGERIINGTFNRVDGKKAVEKFQNSNLDFPKAIVCSNDHQVYGLIKCLKKIGKKVPEDVIVTGFDNVVKILGDDIIYTTVERNKNKYGEIVVPKLFDLIKGKNIDIKLNYVAHSLVFGNTCGCVSNYKEDNTKKLYDSTEFMKNNVYQSCRMLSNLNGAVSIKELVSKLEKWVERLQADEFYLCLCEDWEGQVTYEGADEGDSFERFHRTQGYAENITCVINFRDGEFHEGNHFKTKNILPNSDKPYESRIYMYSPLHFIDRCFGYAVCGFDTLNFDKKLNFTNFTHNIINSLEIIRRENQLKCLIKKFNKLSMSDGLTGIYNRNGFLASTENMIERHRFLNTEMFIGYFDLDGLKVINDSFGHEEGDIAIKTLATALKDCKGHDDICGRIGGDEFVFLGVNYTQSEIESFLQRVVEHIAHYNLVSKNQFQVSTSYGYHTFKSSENTSISSYIDIADGKMYRAKYEKKKKQR